MPGCLRPPGSRPARRLPDRCCPRGCLRRAARL